jgi:hypothetical protein
VSGVAEGVELGDPSDFKELNGITDNLDAACDARFRNWSWTRQLSESLEHLSRDKRLVRLWIR